jgi:hypothetical protein
MLFQTAKFDITKYALEKQDSEIFCLLTKSLVSVSLNIE